ncbi:MAG: class I SAM-dependent methyltransferase [Polyangiaceae bacterium]
MAEDGSRSLEELYLRLTFDLVAVEAFDHLHWGLWTEVPKKVERFAEARRAYAEEVVGWVRGEDQRVLDVGCGLGGIARLLAERGHRVTALTPEARHLAALADHGVAGLEVRGLRFEDLVAEPTFDRILFAESFNFFADRIGETLARAAASLRPGGELVIAELLSERSLAAIQDAGWSILQRRDLSDGVAFTVEALQGVFDRFVAPYRALERAALTAVDPALAARVETALTSEVPNRAAQSLFAGRVVERDMLADARYELLLLSPPESS